MDIAALAERFDEPLRGEIEAIQPGIQEPAAFASADAVPGPRAGPAPEQSQPAILQPVAVPSTQSVPQPLAATLPLPSNPKPWAKPILSRSALTAALGVLALVPAAFFIVQLWQDMVRPHGDGAALPREALGARETVYAKKDTARLEAEANAVEQAAASGANDVTGSLPQAAAVGWSISPDVAAALPFSVPAQTGASGVQTEASDLAPSPAATETTFPAEPSLAATVPSPRRKPAPPAEAEAPVRTVKVVTIQPPSERKPHDGAYALGSPADEPAEWMVTKTAVDMHAKAQQSSETVKVAQGGMKVRVTGRHRGWIQVQDPKSSTTGWIYNRFLKPADVPAQ